MASRIDTLISKCASWDEFVLLVNNQQDNKFKGELFERLTQVFLKTSSIYASKLENVWWCNNNELPERVRKKLRLPTTDEGIDLICETVEGEFWSVQCKYKADQDKPLNHRELSTFTSLSFNTAKNIVLGLVVHTSTKKVRKSDLMANVTEVGLAKWLEISQDDWKRIRSVCRANTLSPPKKRKPRKHQKAAIKDAIDYFSKRSVSRGKLIMPCGTGKSLTAFWIAQALGSKTIVVAVPSLALIRQSLGDWTAEFLAHDVRPEWIAVCSDSTVGNTGDADSTVASVYETGIPTTTDELIIQKFLKRKSKSPKIIFTTYQSGQKLCEVTKNFSLKFDLLICDEAHKTVGTSNKSFATMLFDENIRVKHRIFMTATERVYRQRTDDVVSMDNPKIYGKVFHHLAFKEAIKQKIICDYKILTIAVTAEEAKALIENNEGLRVADGKDSYETDAHNLSVGLTLQKVFEKYKIKHALTFHSSIKRAQFFSNQQDLLPTSYEIKNYHVSSKFSAGERARMLQQFASDDLSLISNARCLTEGVDIPSIDCVVFADPKHSTVDIVQAAGRAMRQSKDTGKEYGYILLPLIIPEDDDLSDFAADTTFKDITRVITSLSTQDERIVEQMRVRAERPSSVPSDIVQFETDVFNLTSIKYEDLRAAINTRVWTSIGKVNWRLFEEAKIHVQSLNLQSNRQYQKITLPPDIPKTPDRVYKYQGWVSWSDWLGHEYTASRNRDYLSYSEASKLVQSKKINSWSEWCMWRKSKDFPSKLPKEPSRTYHNNGWVNFSVFIGKENIEYLDYENAKKIMHQFGLKGLKEFKQFKKDGYMPNNIPSTPDRYYKNNGWIGLADFLGNYNLSGKQLSEKQLSYEEAKALILTLGLKSRSAYKNYIKKNNFPVSLPRSPDNKYKNNGWVSWGEFLGTGLISFNKIEPIPFKKAKEFAQKLKLRSMKEWYEFYEKGKIPKSIPKYPQYAKHYKEEWCGVADFLGYENPNEIYVNGIPFKSLFEAAKYYGIKYVTAKARRRKGLSIEASLGIEEPLPNDTNDKNDS